MESLPAVQARPRVPSLERLLENQHDVITRQQALAGGLSDQGIYHRTHAGGRWQRLLPGVFLTTTGTPTGEQRDVAAVLYCGRGSTLTGSSALRRHGVPGLGAHTVDVLIPATRRKLSTDYVVVHRTSRIPPFVCYEGPVQFALPARAVADAVLDLHDLSTVRAVVAAAVQSRLCTVEQLIVELESGPIRGSAPLRTALREVAAGAGSGREAEMMALIRRGRLPMPLFNPKLYNGADFIAQPDAWWRDEGVAAEVDSKEWHLSPQDWERTMRRHARMTSLGILVLHYSPRQIREEPDEVLATIRAALGSRRGQRAPRVRTVPAAG